MNSGLVWIRVRAHEGKRLLDDVARALGIVEDVEAMLSVCIVEQVQRRVLARRLGGEAVVAPGVLLLV